MKLIPRNHFRTESAAEIEVFELLRDVQLGPHWTCLHSLNLSDHHRFKVWSEIDFLLIGPKGIYVLEVKGGGITCRDGIWYGVNRRGIEHEKKESPFDQARDARYALEKSLFELAPEVKWNREFCFGWGVVFPDIDKFEIASAELPLELVCDRADCSSAKRFTKYLIRTIEYWNNKSTKNEASNARLIDRCSKLLRPNFDLAPSLTYKSQQLHEKLVALTDEQYEKLDAIEEADRIICTGGAGTGKTFLAIATARRSAAEGDKTLVCVPRKFLAAYLNFQENHERLTILSFEEVQSLLKTKGFMKFDVLVVDEGQDLLSLDSIAMIDGSISGGLEKGRWRWFMDHNNQAGVVGEVEAEALELLKEYGQVPLKLKRNCRNTPEIVMQTQLSTGAELGKAESKGFGMAPEYAAFPKEDFQNEVEKKIASWLKEEIRPSDIAILTAGSSAKELFSSFSYPFRKQIEVLTTDNVVGCERIVLSTIKDFKGLERSFVAVTDLYETSMFSTLTQFLYVGMTRANLGLWLCMTPEFKKSLDEAQTINAIELAKMAPK